MPDGLVSFSCKLVEKVDDSRANVNDETSFEFEDISHRTRLHDAVYKRRMINAIITGGAIRLSYISKDLIGELYEMSPELPTLYRNIIYLNDYLLKVYNEVLKKNENANAAVLVHRSLGKGGLVLRKILI